MYIYILNSVINVLFPFGTDEQVTIIPKVPVNENKEVKFREEGGRQKG